MAVDNFIYQGINRAVSDFSGARFCEELINLRPVQGGLVPVRDFTVRFANTSFYRVYVHHTTYGDKYLALRRDGDAVKLSWVDEYGVVQQDLFNTPWDTSETVESIHFAAAGNIFLVSMCDTYNSVYKNVAYTWKGTEYVKMEADIPDIDYAITDGLTLVSATETIAAVTTDSSPAEVISSVESGLNAIQENNTRLCLGPIIIATALKTKDGNTFWTGNWKIYDPIKTIGTTSPPYVNGTIFPDQNYTDFFQRYDGHGYIMNESGTTPADYGGLHSITAYGTVVTVTFPAINQNNATDWDPDTSVIQSVEVYCSKPVPYLDTSAAYDGFKCNEIPATDGLYYLVLPQAKYADMDFAGQLLYHQASIPMTSLTEAEQVVTLTFGGNQQVTEEILDTDAGALTRYGRLVSYNARFHFFDSVAKIEVGKPFFLFGPDIYDTGETDIFVKYSDSENSELVHVDNITGVKGDAYLVIAPSLNIKEVITYGHKSGYYYVRKYRMTDSSSYNFTVCKDGPYDFVDAATSPIQEYEDAMGGDTSVFTNERDAINVTEQYNPFVFLVEHSYKAPGNVIDVQPQMAGLTDASYGRDPLSVSTERGLYNLTLGSANVLYGAFVPVSNVVAKRGGVPTELGIFFLGDGALWLIAGRRATLVSDALSEGPHKYVRGCAGYQKISGPDMNYTPSSTVVSPLYNVGDALSKVPFETFANGGKLGYDRFKMELFVSNPSYNYTYVLSLKTRQWHKLSRRVWQDEPGSILVNTPGGQGTMNVLDTTSVTTGTVTVHLQSRPFSNGFQYTHVHRIVAMMRAKLSGTSGHVATAALYGSDDLQDWKLLAYAKRNGSTDNPLYVSQLRTPAAARSWRYYTVCIGGTVQAGGDFPTDIGPVLVDHEPVIRRIG